MKATEQDSKNIPYSIKILSDGLQEAALQFWEGDIKAIAKKVEMTEQAIRPYFKGEVSSPETGKKLIKVARSVIMSHVKEVKKLVA